MEMIQSADGTRIAVDRSGAGAPLVIVLGAFCDRSTSKPLAALLAPRYTVYEYDRRARGDSSNGLRLSIEREVQDLAAVVTAAGEAPFVYGHSSGALLALEAAARGVQMRRLAVYEPPYTGAHDPGPEFGRHLDELVATGRRDEAAEQWLAVTGTPPPIIESIKRGPGWVQRQALAHTLSQDLRLANSGRVPLERLDAIEIPVLALAGADSPPWASLTTAVLAGSLPHASERIVDGQQHIPADSVIGEILESFFV
ncbi:MAG TPA: alpha/beta hydrolase [Solirubrobacteraceae bacterium]|nr:alpha/beta hydrolase [Solirubrobacteraceae bacterium]